MNPLRPFAQSNRPSLLMLGTFCFSLPLGAYQQLWGHWLGMANLSLFGLTLFFALKWAANGRPRIPFDLLWPAILLGIWGLAVWGAGFEKGGMLALSALIFVLAVDASVGQHKPEVLLFLFLSATATTALTTVLSNYSMVFPTAFDNYSDTVAAGPLDVREAVFLFHLGLMCAIGLVFLTHRPSKWLLLLPMMLVMAGLECVLAAVKPDGTGTGLAWSFSPPMLPATLLSIWLCARVAAKLTVAEGAFPDKTRHVWIVLVIVSAIAALCLEIMPGPAAALLLGLAASRGCPGVKGERLGWSLAPPLIATIVLAAAHAVVVFPGEARDYESAVSTLVANGETEAARTRLERVLRVRPCEGRAQWWTAVVALEEGRVEEGADYFARSLANRPGAAVLPPVDDGMVESFITRMRNESAELPENARGLAYERCLVAAGRADHALSLLSLRGEGSAGGGSSAPGPAANALARLMGSTELVKTFAGWDTSSLVRILSTANGLCGMEDAPAEMPPDMLPLVLCARRQGERLVYMAFSPQGELGASLRMTPPMALEGANKFPEPVWLSPAREEDGEWWVSLAGIAEIRLSGGLEAHHHQPPRAEARMMPDQWMILCVLPQNIDGLKAGMAE